MKFTPSATFFLFSAAAVFAQQGGSTKPASPMDPASVLAPFLNAQGQSATQATTATATQASATAAQAQQEGADVLGTVISQAKALEQVFAKSPELQNLVKSLMGSVSSGKDGEANKTLGKLMAAANLTPEQLSLLKELRVGLDVLTLKRNFDPKDPALAGPVGQAVQAIQTRNPAQAFLALTQIAQKANLTPQQKDLIQSLIANYAPAAQKPLEAASGILNTFRAVGGGN